MFARILVLAVFALAAVAAPASSRSPDRISLVRDAEVENIIRVYAAPVFRAADLDPDAIRVHLVNDDALNAFVAGGLNLFLNTGLLIRSENPSQLIGVIAHETGHIAGGHLTRLGEAVESASAEALLSILLGAAAAAASGRGDVGTAVMMGGQQAAGRSLLRYSRTQESAADQAAVRLLDAVGISAQGLLSFMEILGEQELLVSERQDPYVRTHPLSRERVAFLRHHVEASTASGAALPPEFSEMHRRLRAKLFAFLKPPPLTFQRYKADDPALEARYARAIAHYRKPELDKALALIDGLIGERPDDAYFHELKGQMLFENGRARDALEPYRRAVALLPDSPLLRIALAQVQTAVSDAALLEDAREHLTRALVKERDNYSAWRLMAIAAGRLGDEGMAALAMAEQALLGRRLGDAAAHADRAARLLSANSPSWLRAQDIKERASQLKEQKGR